MAIIEETELENVSGGKNSEPTFPYTVVFGDTLSGIAQRFHTDVKTLQKINGIANPDVIKVGWVLRIPNKNVKGGWL